MKEKSNAKRNIIIIIGVIIIICLSIVILWKTGVIFKNNNDMKPTYPIDDKKHLDTDLSTINNNIITKDNYKYLTKKNDGTVLDKVTEQVLYDPKEIYVADEDNKFPNINELDKNEISEYLKYFSFVFPLQSFDKFDDNTIAIIVSLSANLYQPRTVREIKRIAEKYFGIIDYELPTGTYDLKYYGSYSITKMNGYYVRSSIQNSQKINITAFPQKLEVNNNEITLYKNVTPYNTEEGQFGCYLPEDPKNECVMGYYIQKLTYDDGRNLIINKIEYKSNPNYAGPKVEKYN